MRTFSNRFSPLANRAGLFLLKKSKYRLCPFKKSLAEESLIQTLFRSIPNNCSSFMSCEKMSLSILPNFSFSYKKHDQKT